MQYDDVLRAMTPEIYARMKDAVETGRWPDGQKLTPAQLENAMELVMVYQAKRLQQDDHFSIAPTGELVMKTKGDLRAELRLRAGADIARFQVNEPSIDGSDSEIPPSNDSQEKPN
ncbi:YeaC family protein [Aliidiomarina sp.]|uniref:YeaC family protein n=1 Tax=Aliidiomarina sp. TaxID=1872439 RepID=UPI003A4D74F5